MRLRDYELICRSPAPSMPAVEQADSSREEMTPTGRASFWRRFAGFLIDFLVLLPVQIPLSVFAFWLAPDGARIAIALALTLAFQFAYYIPLISRFGRTLGAYAMEIRIVSLDDNEMPPGYGRATIRQLVPLAAGLVPFVGGLVYAIVYLWMLWDPMNQGLHDKAAGTIVINSPRPRRDAE